MDLFVNIHRDCQFHMRLFNCLSRFICNSFILFVKFYAIKVFFVGTSIKVKTMTDEQKAKVVELKAPKCFSHDQPAPVYYYDEKKNEEFILFASSQWSFDSCYKYNITKNEYSDFAPYPNNFSTYWHGHAVDPNNGKYYIFGGGNRILGEFDLNSEKSDGKWKVYHHDVNDNDGLDPTQLKNSHGVYIPHWEKLLLIGATHTCLVDLTKQNKTFIDIQKYDTELPESIDYGEFRILYSKPLQKLYIFVDNHENMLCLDCNKPYDKDTNNFEAIPLPTTTALHYGNLKNNLYALSYDGNILISINVDQKEVQSMDIGNEHTKWMKSNYIFRHLKTRFNALDVVVSKENDAYFFNTYPDDDLFCIRISLYDMIPKDILNRYSKALVYGFVRESVSGLSIPNEIVEMLVMFYM